MGQGRSGVPWRWEEASLLELKGLTGRGQEVGKSGWEWGKFQCRRVSAGRELVGWEGH